MIKYLRILLMTSLVLTIGAAKEEKIIGAADSSQWKLVWSDEFNYVGAPDPEKWEPEVGHVRNDELQYYTDNRKENAYVDKGVLTITGQKEKFPNIRYQPGSSNWTQKRKFADYTSACITTWGKASWKYGRIEVRAKLPAGKGTWPAIWTLGDNRGDIGWPNCGEIDIMEYVGKEPDDVHANFHGGNIKGSRGHTLHGAKPTSDFHIYALEWDEKGAAVYYDDNPHHKVVFGDSPDSPFRKPHYLLINLALGGSWGGPLDDSSLPHKYLIDYVRVYKKK